MFMVFYKQVYSFYWTSINRKILYFHYLLQAYHKANDERKQYVLEINAAKGTINEMKNRQRMLMAAGQENSNTPRTHRDTTG